MPFSFANDFILLDDEEALLLCVPNCLRSCSIYVRQLSLRFERTIWKNEFVNWMGVLFDSLILHIIRVSQRCGWLNCISLVGCLAI